MKLVKKNNDVSSQNLSNVKEQLISVPLHPIKAIFSDCGRVRHRVVAVRMLNESLCGS